MVDNARLAPMKLILGSIIDYLFILVNRVIMILNCEHILVISLTINGMILLCCVIVKFGRKITEKCCVRKDNILARMFRNYDDKPCILAKILTEQVTTWMVCVMALVAVCSREVIEFPFTRNSETSMFINAIFEIIIGKYIFCIASDIMLQEHLGSVRFKINTIHNIVTLVCYSVFLSYEQNILLGLIGAMMEVNNTAIEILRTLKEIGSVETNPYRKISVVNCVLALTFRGVIPIVFLIIAVFHEKPFKMEYGPLTTFFLSIIFFSVISVWVVLSSVRRVVKLFLLRKEDCCRQSQRQSQFSDDFKRNNLGYLPRCDNVNLSDISENGKMNYNNKKTFPKVNIENACAVFHHATAYQLSTDTENTTRDMQIYDDRTSDSLSNDSSVVVRFHRGMEELSSSERSDSSGVGFLDNHSVISENNFQRATLGSAIHNNLNDLSQISILEHNSINNSDSNIDVSETFPRNNEEHV